MLEMLMLLGTGLVAAGIAGMTGIASQPDEDAGETTRPEDDLSEFEMGDSFGSGAGENILSALHRIGDEMDDASHAPDSEIIAVAEDPADPLTGAESTEDAAETAGSDESDGAPEATDGADLDTGVDEVIAAVADAVADAPENSPEESAPESPVADPEPSTDAAPVAESDEAPAAVADATPAGPGPDDAETDVALDYASGEAPEDGDGPEIISDFMAGLERLSLLLPEDMGEDTQVRIEPAGDAGEDAAVVLEDALGSLTAAVIKGGYGSVGPEDIDLEYAA